LPRHLDDSRALEILLEWHGNDNGVCGNSPARHHGCKAGGVGVDGAQGNSSYTRESSKAIHLSQLQGKR